MKIMLHELRDSRSHMYVWRRKYLDAVHNGEISFADAVDDYLGQSSTAR